MLDGGILVVSEKVHFSDPAANASIVELHEDFKRANDYSDLEIARKRNSLENVLVPDTIDGLQGRLADAGFARSVVWLQHYNFVSLLAFP